jgi:beta-glucosidase
MNNQLKKQITLALLLGGVGSLALMGWIVSPSTAYRDLNKNGRMDVYEDASQPVEARVTDLLAQMNLEEKAGMMFISGTRINDDGSLDDVPGKGMFARMP